MKVCRKRTASSRWRREGKHTCQEHKGTGTRNGVGKKASGAGGTIKASG
jgi:hypothetical protein